MIKNILQKGPLGKNWTRKEALERALARKLYLAEHSQIDSTRKKAVEQCEEIIKELEKGKKKKRVSQK